MTATVDTSFLVSLTNLVEANHAACLRVAETPNESLIIPQVIPPEVTYPFAGHQGSHVMEAFVGQFLSPGWLLVPLETADLARAHLARAVRESGPGFHRFVHRCFRGASERAPLPDP